MELTLPEAELTGILWLATIPSIASAIGDRISDVIPRDAVFPLIRVARTGGTVDRPWRDNPTLQLELWGEIDPSGTPNYVSADQISQLSRDIIAAVPADGRVGVIGDANVYGMFVTLGPLSQPDPTSYRPRRIVEVSFEMEPA